MNTAKQYLSRLADNVPSPEGDYENYSSGREVVVFGTGTYGQDAVETLQADAIKTAYFCDNSKSKQGTIINGLEVIGPKQLKKDMFVYVSTSLYNGSICSQLTEMGIPHTTIDAYWTAKYIDKCLEVFDLLEDERSVTVLKNVLEYRFMPDERLFVSVAEEGQYFALPYFSLLNPNEIIVDAGAFVGDILERFIERTAGGGGTFGRIYAFEPESKAYRAMLSRRKRLLEEWLLDESQVECVQAGVGEEEGFFGFCEKNTGSSFVDSGEHKKRVVSLDKYLKDVPVTYIKADIEGFEMNMLLGAKDLIRRFKPKLAISIYHKLQDAFEIPMYIHSLVPEYKMAVRHHSNIRYETVLYCWVP